MQMPSAMFSVKQRVQYIQVFHKVWFGLFRFVQPLYPVQFNHINTSMSYFFDSVSQQLCNAWTVSSKNVSYPICSQPSYRPTYTF